MDWRWWKINERQKRFADEYIISGNAHRSAVNAGYSEKYARTNAHKLLENTSIKSYITAQLEELEKQKIAKADEVLQVLTAVLRQELTEEVVQINPVSGEPMVLEKRPSIAEVIKAGSELLKRYPTATAVEKLKLEIEVLKAKLGSDEDDTLITGFTFDRSAENDKS